MFETSFDSIPLLDYDDLIKAPDSFFTTLGYAVTEVGFLYVKNIGLPSDCVKELVDLLPALFGIPIAEKTEIELESSPHFLGYSAVGSETTAGKTDLREQFEFVTQTTPREWSSERPLYERLQGPNQFPPSLPEARQIVETYMANLTRHAEHFMCLVAKALQLPEDTFLSFFSGQNRLKVVRYPAADGVAATQGVGPHKDSSGWWTFLLQASSPEVKGLQVLNKAGDWIDVPNIPGTIVVNIGQAFEVITHGACKATTHRVLGGPVERFSVPFFLGVRGDLTKEEALSSLAQHFQRQGRESEEGANIDSAFLRGCYNTWGESQLRTKIRSHRLAGKRFYPEVYEQYINED
ncbi:hypothetical protein LTS08_001492 [Lithohypha guttulata]|uniref:uncharacterized protein n=1 Tax=Lithohypha guttulata TaxID=1690604 RepID=UPI002DDDC2B1|nr:hypothetical protein LTR51_003843 [Lithohypha guttulata]KAK5105217.1 hypothetical protein LTS08_001492 [Lithohypha guttulata]